MIVPSCNRSSLAIVPLYPGVGRTARIGLCLAQKSAKPAAFRKQWLVDPGLPGAFATDTLIEVRGVVLRVDPGAQQPVPMAGFRTATATLSMDSVEPAATFAGSVRGGL